MQSVAQAGSYASGGLMQAVMPVCATLQQYLCRPNVPDRHGHTQAPHLRSSRSEAPSPHSVRAATSSKRMTNCAQLSCGPARIMPSISRTMGPLPTYPAWCADPQSAARDRVSSQDSAPIGKQGLLTAMCQGVCGA